MTSRLSRTAAVGVVGWTILLPAAGAAPQSAPAGGAKFKANIEYARPSGTSLKLDLYLPATTSRPAPVIVWIHGGGWRMGDKSHCPFASATARGYAVASLDYRLTDKAIFPAQIHDCKAAIRWLRAHAAEYGLDADHIGAVGASAGGHLVALLGTTGGMKELEGTVGDNLKYSSKVQAVADFCGPTAFTGETILGPIAKRERPSLDKLFGGPIADHEDLARLASPAVHVTKDDPPFLIVHGDQDPLVPLRQAQILDEKLTEAGVEHTLHIVKGGGHGGVNPETVHLALSFFDKHLKNAPPGDSATPATRAAP